MRKDSDWNSKKGSDGLIGDIIALDITCGVTWDG